MAGARLNAGHASLLRCARTYSARPLSIVSHLTPDRLNCVRQEHPVRDRRQGGRQGRQKRHMIPGSRGAKVGSQERKLLEHSYVPNGVGTPIHTVPSYQAAEPNPKDPLHRHHSSPRYTRDMAPQLTSNDSRSGALTMPSWLKSEGQGVSKKHRSEC